MEKALLDRDDDRELRALALDRHLLQQLLVLNDLGGSIDPERLANAGNQKDRTSVRVVEDIRQPVETLVPPSVGDRDRLVVENGDEAGRVAFGRHVASAGRAGRREEEKR